MTAFGYMGKILHADLTSEKFEIKELPLEQARSYLGGLGLNAWLMEQVYETGTDPLSPDNPIILPGCRQDSRNHTLPSKRHDLGIRWLHAFCPQSQGSRF
jgi:hypothetical protein